MNGEDRDRLLFELQSIHPDIRLISTDAIVVADWVRRKCRYGCRAYGKQLGCCKAWAFMPSLAPSARPLWLRRFRKEGRR
ncbi:MAG: DUF2284 domain-containing protein [Methanothrix sp.]